MGRKTRMLLLSVSPKNRFGWTIKLTMIASFLTSIHVFYPNIKRVILRRAPAAFSATKLLELIYIYVEPPL